MFHGLQSSSSWCLTPELAPLAPPVCGGIKCSGLMEARQSPRVPTSNPHRLAPHHHVRSTEFRSGTRLLPDLRAGSLILTLITYSAGFFKARSSSSNLCCLSETERKYGSRFKIIEPDNLFIISLLQYYPDFRSNWLKARHTA